MSPLYIFYPNLHAESPLHWDVHKMKPEDPKFGHFLHQRSLHPYADALLSLLRYLRRKNPPSTKRLAIASTCLMIFWKVSEDRIFFCQDCLPLLNQMLRTRQGVECLWAAWERKSLMRREGISKTPALTLACRTYPYYIYYVHTPCTKYT